MSHLLGRVREALAPQLEVERELGGGAMGVVFLGRDVALERPVAIKILRPELATAAAAQRFLAEGRILAQLRHPNLMTVHQAGEAAGLLYYVMEYLTGETLFDRMVREPLTRAEALKLGRDLLDGLEAAHQVGVVHRDVKPENVMLQDGRAVLFDFGIAKSSRSPAHRQGSLIGTPAYMSRNSGKEAMLLRGRTCTGRRWCCTKRSPVTPSGEARRGMACPATSPGFSNAPWRRTPPTGGPMPEHSGGRCGERGRPGTWFAPAR